MTDNGAGFQIDVAAGINENSNNRFAQEALWKNGSGSSSSVCDHPVIVSVSQHLSKTVHNPGVEVTVLNQAIVDDVETSLKFATEGKHEVKRQKWSASVIEMSPSDALNNDDNNWEFVAPFSRRKTELFANALSGSDQKSRSIEKCRHGPATISTRNKEMLNIAQLVTLIENIKDIITIYNASEAFFENDLLKVTAECT